MAAEEIRVPKFGAIIPYDFTAKETGEGTFITEVETPVEITEPNET